jgi:formylmethanofuran dehydrogenase subunit C
MCPTGNWSRVVDHQTSPSRCVRIVISPLPRFTMNKTVTLSLRSIPGVPVEAESLIPENVAGKNEREIGQLPLLVGNRREILSDWFDVTISPGAEGEPPNGTADLVLRGDLTRFKRLGEGMSWGRLVVEGSVGFHAGAHMRGGSLLVQGDAGDFLGAHMRGGLLVVHGNAGHYAAAAYRGQNKGMHGGTLIVTGSAGQLLGARMRRGLIFVRGNSGDVTGFNMQAGTIIVAGTPGARFGARMVRGTVMLLSGDAELLPTFTYDCTYRPGFWALLHRHLTRLGHTPEIDPWSNFRHFSGDHNEGGRGEVLTCVRPAAGELA